MTQKISDVFFRLMKKEDVNEVKNIEDLCFSEPWSQKSFLNSISNENNYFVVAKKHDNIIGYAGMYSVFSEGYIYNIAVHPNSRKMGIGKCLINSLFDNCIKNNLDFLSLEVRVSNKAAINLYEKLKFDTFGIRKNFYSKPREDALIMTKYFK